MSQIICSVFVHGEPKAQPRVRAFARNGRAGVYDPGTAEGWKSLIAAEVKDLAGRCITQAVDLHLEFYFPRPKSHFGSGRNSNRLKTSAPSLHVKKPDLDNLEKAVKDALSEKSGIGLWKDDCQVVRVVKSKHYASYFQPAGMAMEIRYHQEEVCE